MLQLFATSLAILRGSVRVRPRRASLRRWLLAATLACSIHARETAAQDNSGAAASQPSVPQAPVHCLPDGGGYLRARLTGNMRAELAWGNDGTECSGAVRPTDGGIRMRFSHGGTAGHEGLVLVFGIKSLAEGQSARNVPVNVTVIRDGRGEFYSTQGDDKCTLDEVTQQPIVGIPHRARAYRVVARGFCTGPARAVRGKGAVLLSRFDYAGRVDFETEDAPQDDTTVMADTP